MNVLACGEHAVLVELTDAEQRRRLAAHLRAHPLAAQLGLVPGAVTLLVRGDPAALRAELARIDPSALDPADPDNGPTVTLAVRYDGVDLGPVADELGITTEEVIERHCGQAWTAEFTGFTPGFAYLTGDRGGLAVSRLDSPRTAVPAGAVGLAGEYSGVYPRSSPGGWRLIGTCSAPLFDPRRDPPALLAPGARVHFARER